MDTLRKLGLIGLLGLASACGSEDQLVKENPIPTGRICKIANYHMDGAKSIGTTAIDTNRDGNYDEAFVTRGYINVNLDAFVDNGIAEATTHYVAQGVDPSKQKFTGFSDTKPMTPEYQRALKLVCDGQ